MEAYPGEGVGKELGRRRNLHTVGNPLTRVSVGVLESQRTNITRIKKEKNSQNTCLTTTVHREVAQTLASATRVEGLGREVHHSSLE